MNKEHIKEAAESIRQQYVEKPTEVSKIEQLKNLDRKVKNPATIFAYAFGGCSSLVLGMGMCLAMQIVGEGALMIGVGVGLGLLGMSLMAVTYPIYRSILKNRKEKYAKEIIALSSELLNE